MPLTQLFVTHLEDKESTLLNHIVLRVYFALNQAGVGDGVVGSPSFFLLRPPWAWMGVSGLGRGCGLPVAGPVSVGMEYFSSTGRARLP